VPASVITIEHRGCTDTTQQAERQTNQSYSF
jgi:hypothetical protein